VPTRHVHVELNRRHDVGGEILGVKVVVRNHGAVRQHAVCHGRRERNAPKPNDIEDGSGCKRYRACISCRPALQPRYRLSLL
jgi:hypothetical protein